MLFFFKVFNSYQRKHKKAFTGTVVNLTCHSINGGSLEITITAPSVPVITSFWVVISSRIPCHQSPVSFSQNIKILRNAMHFYSPCFNNRLGEAKLKIENIQYF